jgi:phage baseplate assembly protein W
MSDSAAAVSQIEDSIQSIEDIIDRLQEIFALRKYKLAGAKVAVNAAVRDAIPLRKIMDAVETATARYDDLVTLSRTRAQCLVETQICVALEANDAATSARVKHDTLLKNHASPESIAEAQAVAYELQSVANLQRVIDIALRFKWDNLEFPTFV